ncbi:MAG: hypothetical protein AAGF89_16255 [Bacteroidota bacterium]
MHPPGELGDHLRAAAQIHLMLRRGQENGWALADEYPYLAD